MFVSRCLCLIDDESQRLVGIKAIMFSVNINFPIFKSLAIHNERTHFAMALDLLLMMITTSNVFMQLSI